MLPNRIKLSKNSTDKFRYLKMSTGLTPNILARVAIMLALRDGPNIINVIPDTDGQELNKSVLFGDHEHVYEVMIKQFIHEAKDPRTISQVISSLIETGSHKMGHVKGLNALCEL